MAVYIRQLLPHIKLIGVEAEGSACLKAALEAGEPVNLARVSLFADGVAVKRIGDETFRVCREYLDEVVTVSNDEICAALKDIFEDTRAIAEPSGALSLAGLKKYVELNQTQGGRMAAILSGANVNFHSLRYVSERCELGEKREGMLAVTIPERKGAFLAFCQQLGSRRITSYNVCYTKLLRCVPAPWPPSPRSPAGRRYGRPAGRWRGGLPRRSPARRSPGRRG